MNEENVVKSKKSSRLNPKKQQKVQLHVDSSWKTGEIDVVIQLQQKLEEAPKVIKNLKVYFNTSGDIIGSHLIQKLKNDHHLREQNSISFLDNARQLFVYGFVIPKQTYDMTKTVAKKFLHNKTLSLKVRNKKKIIIQALIQEQREQYEEGQEQKNNKGQKQKKIGEVVEKVALWRKFYTGFYDELGNYIQKPLQSAAQEVGIAKKTLDDYLLQIRNGKKYGFNFNEKYNSKIGELRAFVRDEKKRENGK